jgi:hypothetical protein
MINDRTYEDTDPLCQKKTPLIRRKNIMHMLHHHIYNNLSNSEPRTCLIYLHDCNHDLNLKKIYILDINYKLLKL